MYQMVLITSAKEIKFINWMRSCTIQYVVVAHVLVSLGRTASFGKQGDALYDQYKFILRCGCQCAMPAFFYFSGRASACGFNVNRKDSKIHPIFLPLFWLLKKILKFGGLLLVGTLFFVIPSAYIGREYRPQENVDPNMGFPEFAKLYFIDEFPRNGFEWLWFLVALFQVQTFNYPFLKLYQQIKREQRGIELKKDWALLFWWILIFGIIYWLAVIVFKLDFILSIFGQIAIIVELLMLIYLQKIIEYKLLILRTLQVPILTLIYAAIMPHYLNLDKGLDQYTCMFIFYNMFYVKGFTDQQTYYEYSFYQTKSYYKRYKPIAVFLLLIGLIVTVPGNDQNTGELWIYPIYLTWNQRMLFVCGTWLQLFVMIRWFQTYYNEDLHPGLFVLAKQSATVTYIVHFFWIEIPNRYIVYKYKLGIFWGFVVVFSFTFIANFLTYWILSKIKCLGTVFGIPQKKKKKNDKLKDKPQKTNKEEVQNP